MKGEYMCIFWHRCGVQSSKENFIKRFFKRIKICPFKGRIKRYKNVLNALKRKVWVSVNKSVITRVSSVPNVILLHGGGFNCIRYLERLGT